MNSHFHKVMSNTRYLHKACYWHPRLKLMTASNLLGTYTKGWILPDRAKVKALHHYPMPTTIADICSLLSLGSQLSPFIPDVAHLMTDFRQLLKQDRAFTWIDRQDKAFRDIKAAIIEHMTLRHIDSQRHTTLLTDASRSEGMDGAINQSINAQTT